MPVQHLPPARQIRSQARTQSVLTPTPREPLVGNLTSTFKGLSEDGGEEWEDSVEEKESDGDEVVAPAVGVSEGTGGPTIAQSNQSVSNKYYTSLFAIMKQMTKAMGNLQEASRPPAFKTSSMKAPELFYETKAFKLRISLQYFQLLFHNYQAHFSEDKNKVLYYT
ncbi:hypothetical protein O181_018467 [Austropuccinia psidii MF-1]|uniref:Uncharacterized protein n=1 Tax=Austropuccinia psidii MF-1 TaxID=1389203 RepID=A0A9Q3GTJ5_9BASI|nr:hypothetical protein [Austropuccinia psidii MF-1]